MRISDWISDVCSSDLGIYLQLGEAEGDDKPKRASLPKGLAPAEVDLAKGLALLALPREIGSHPEDGKPITAGIGRYGPYVKHGSTYRSLPQGDDVVTVGLNHIGRASGRDRVSQYV